MKTRILHIFTRTPLHVGAGSSVGAIDQPVQRERHTGFPIIPGSSLKGVLRDTATRFSEIAGDDVDRLFGKEGTESGDSTAGHLSFGEARLLAFPLRSARGSFALATCPLALSRYARDYGLDLEIPPIDSGDCLAGMKVTIGNKAVLEEYTFNCKGDFPETWQNHLQEILDDAVIKGSAGRWVLLADGDFSHFAINACQVAQHIRIDSETGTVKKGALFNTETVPSETLFYSAATAMRKESHDNPLFTHYETEQLLQFGGDSTTGLGFSTVKLAPAKA